MWSRSYPKGAFAPEEDGCASGGGGGGDPLDGGDAAVGDRDGLVGQIEDQPVVADLAEGAHQWLPAVGHGDLHAAADVRLGLSLPQRPHGPGDLAELPDVADTRQGPVPGN